jgi:uncharacterized protein (DUF302 family)
LAHLANIADNDGLPANIGDRLRSGEPVHYIVESDKSFYEATFDLEPVVQRLGFVVLHVHDLGETLRRKEIDLDDDCKVFEICNFRQMEKLLAIDMRLSLALPWRISVFTENGATKLGLIRPEPLMAALSQNTELARVAREIEEKMVQIIDETR